MLIHQEETCRLGKTIDHLRKPTIWEIYGGWYPGDEHIGDVARIVLYIHVRYNLSLGAVGNLDMFLTWHNLDPVDDFERARNDRIYNIQENRNPLLIILN